MRAAIPNGVLNMKSPRSSPLSAPKSKFTRYPIILRPEELGASSTGVCFSVHRLNRANARNRWALVPVFRGVWPREICFFGVRLGVIASSLTIAYRLFFRAEMFCPKRGEHLG